MMREIRYRKKSGFVGIFNQKYSDDNVPFLHCIKIPCLNINLVLKRYYETLLCYPI